MLAVVFGAVFAAGTAFAMQWIQTTSSESAAAAATKQTTMLIDRSRAAEAATADLRERLAALQQERVALVAWKSDAQLHAAAATEQDSALIEDAYVAAEAGSLVDAALIAWYASEVHQAGRMTDEQTIERLSAVIRDIVNRAGEAEDSGTESP